MHMISLHGPSKRLAKDPKAHLSAQDRSCSQLVSDDLKTGHLLNCHRSDTNNLVVQLIVPCMPRPLSLCLRNQTFGSFLVNEITFGKRDMMVAPLHLANSVQI